MPEEKILRIKPTRHIEYALIAALAVLAIFLAVEAVTALYAMNYPTTAPADTITVNGTGQVSLAPDIAHITFSITQTAATAAAAQTAATKQANAAINYVEGQGVAAADVTTLSYDISPQYAQTTCPPGVFCPAVNSNTITGYQVSETVQVTVRDLSNVGTLLQGLGQQNVQDVSGPDFGLSSPTEGDDAARAQAIANAKLEAQTLAKQLGVSLGRIVSFSENGNEPYPVAYAMNASSGSGSSAPSPEVPAGENQYTSSVSVTYAIH